MYIYPQQWSVIWPFWHSGMNLLSELPRPLGVQLRDRRFRLVTGQLKIPYRKWALSPLNVVVFSPLIHDLGEL